MSNLHNNIEGNYRKEEPVGHMSWLLIQLYNTKQYSIIHSVDLVKTMPQTIFINNIIQYHRDQLMLHGKIVAASDDRNCLEQQLRQFMQNQDKLLIRTGSESTGGVITPAGPGAVTTLAAQNNIFYNKKWYLVQYSKVPNHIIHSIQQHDTILWQFINNANEIYIQDDKYQRLAIILYASDHKNDVINEMLALKVNCLNEVFTDPNYHMQNISWFLVQYSTENNDTIYAVIHENDIIWKLENLYSDIVVYLKDQQQIYQCLILKRSTDRYELDLKLNLIKEISLLSQFPLNKDNKISSIDYSMGPCHIDTEFNCIDMEYIRFNRSTQTETPPPILPVAVILNDENPMEDHDDIDAIENKIKHEILDENIMRYSLNINMNYGNNESDVLQRLEVMDCRMQHEKMIINNSFKSLNSIRDALNQKLECINYLLNNNDQ